MKVMTIIGTRPEIIRLSRVIPKLDSIDGVEQVLVHTGQNYDFELNGVFFRDLEVREPDAFLDVAGDSLGQTLGKILSRSEEVMRSHRPDAVLILGDTNSALSAIMAKRLHIPVFHMEAGNRSFDANVPEEVNRRIVDHTADFNLVYSEHARRNLEAEGLPPRNIYLTGSPMKEVLEHQRDKIAASRATSEMGLRPKEFFLVSTHREENVDDSSRLRTLLESLAALNSEFGIPVVVSLHPRTRARIDKLEVALPAGLVFNRPFSFSEYCRLQLDARCVLSDSGTISEESAILDFPAVILRDSMERPESLDTGTAILSGLTYPQIRAAVGAARSSRRDVPAAYQISDTSSRVAGLVLSLAHVHREWAGLRG